MKKFFVSLVMLLSTSAASLFAQSSLIATLSHEGEITAFYGADALKKAHEAAAHGDAITLSSGTFNATDITKAITLRGAGMQLDTINNVLPTTIAGDFSIKIENEGMDRLTLEGIYHNSLIKHSGTALKGARFMKCRFSSLNLSNVENVSFIHCKIASDVENFISGSFVNCFICGCNVGNSQFLNSIIVVKGHSCGGSYSNCGTYNLGKLANSNLTNCILIGANHGYSNYYGTYSYDILPSSSIAYNCVAINCSENQCFEYISNTTNSFSTYSEVFKDFIGTYNDDITFELTDEAKAKFLGTDDTQVGIYGGSFPYDPTTTNPQITKCNVAAKSTADGKLSVDIEVAGVE